MNILKQEIQERWRKSSGVTTVDFIMQDIDLSYNAGKADMLDIVLKEIDEQKQKYIRNNIEEFGGWQDEIDTCNKILKTLKSRFY